MLYLGRQTDTRTKLDRKKYLNIDDRIVQLILIDNICAFIHILAQKSFILCRIYPVTETAFET